MDDDARAVILAVDDAPDDLVRLERALVTRYGTDYDVRCSSSPAAALRQLDDLAAEGTPVALVLAAHWMTDALGTDVLQRAGSLHRTAKRVLLVSWGDRAVAEPILAALAVGRFDYYLPKPTEPPDEGFHTVVQGFLAEWSRQSGVGFTPVVAVGEARSARLRELRDLLTRNGLLHDVFEPESAEGRARLHAAGVDAVDAPVLFVLDHPALVDPTNAELAGALGVNAEPLDGLFDMAIVGAGPAGLAAAVAGASEGLRTLVIEREAIGGQAGTSSRIRNFLGFPTGISGSDLAVRSYEQAWMFGTRFHFMSSVTALHPVDGHHALVLSGGTVITSRTVVLATGVTYRRLSQPGLARFHGAGVFYGAAVTEAPGVRGERVAVVGGGNSAGQAAVHLASYAEHVTVLVRGDGVAATMSEYLVRLLAATPNISVRPHAEIVDGEGDDHLEAIVVRDGPTGGLTVEPTRALFVLIGAEPHTAWLPDEVRRDAWGYVLTGHDLLVEGAPPADWTRPRPPLLLETSVPGVFAAGDVRHRSVKRVASAVGEGSIAVTLVHAFLADD